LNKIFIGIAVEIIKYTLLTSDAIYNDIAVYSKRDLDVCCSHSSIGYDTGLDSRSGYSLAKPKIHTSPNKFFKHLSL